MSATAVLYGIKAAGGLAQGYFGYTQMQEAARREEALRKQGMPQMQTPQEYFDLYQNASRSRQFEDEKAMTQSILASNLATLQQAGSRAVIGGAPAAQITAQRGMASAANRDFARQQQALGQLAAAQQRTAQLNFQVNANQYARDLLTAQAGYQAGAETMISGFGDAIGAGIGMAGAIENNRSAKTKRSDEDPISGGFVDAFGREVSVRPGMEDQFTPIGEYRSTTTSVPEVTVPEESFGAEVPFANMTRQEQLDYDDSLFDSSPLTAEEKRRLDEAQRLNALERQGVTPIDLDYYYTNPNVPPRRYNKGGSVTTPGKYTADHSVEYDVKTKSGKTIATVTGDETLVFNPEQRRFLKRVIGKLIKGQTIKPSKADTKQANQTLKAFKK